MSHDLPLSHRGKYYYCTKITDYILNHTKSRDSAVGIATGCRLDDQGVESESIWVKNFTPSRCQDMVLGPTTFLSNKYWGLFPWR